MRTFITVEEARACIIEAAPTVVEEIVPLAQALGRILAREVISKEAIPPFPNSAMDGFAVRSGDLGPEGGSLRLMGEVRAGQWPEDEVTPGTCLRIMTGAAMPPGADSVVPVEWTRTSGSEVWIDRAAHAERHVRPAGQDIGIGEKVLHRGTRLGPSELSVLATLGESRVTVGARPLVAVIATGDELVSPHETPGPGQIRNSNGPALAARVLEAGGQVGQPLLARDRREDVDRIITAALSSDVLVFSGGVSMGEYDLVREVLDARGFEAAFWKVKQRPGKPLAFGVLEGRPVFGLPGNPVSSAVCFDQYVRPFLLHMQGASETRRPRLHATLRGSFAKPASLHVFARGILDSLPDGRLEVRQAGAQGSNISTSLVKANCLVHLPADWDQAAAGMTAEVEMLF